jgi:hypothetical protein
MKFFTNHGNNDNNKKSLGKKKKIIKIVESATPDWTLV